VVEAPFDSINGVHDLLYTFKCEIGHCDRNIDFSSGKESIDRQEAEAWRTIDKDIVIRFEPTIYAPFEHFLSPEYCGQIYFSVREVWM
jgi:hypothetical protein